MTPEELKRAKEIAKRILDDDEILKAVSPFNKTHVYLAKAVLHLSEAVKESGDIMDIATSGLSVKWRAVKWLSKYGENKSGDGL